MIPSRPRHITPAMSALIPRLPRSIGPNSPRVNLNKHWDELKTWHQSLEEHRLKALAAHLRMKSSNEPGTDGISSDDDLSNRGCTMERTFAEALVDNQIKKNVGHPKDYGFPSCNGLKQRGDYGNDARESLVVTII